ncbi:MAG: hypothetical protein GY774_29210 [Planctomycetes bacterium]|nr:hypothetical protein [Planctomycetota bacterium]
MAREMVDECREVATIWGVKQICFFSALQRFSTRAFPRRTAYYWGKAVKTIKVAEEWYFTRMNRFNGMLKSFAHEDENMDFLQHRGIEELRQFLKDDLHFNERGLVKHWKSLRRWTIIQSKKAKPWPPA